MATLTTTKMLVSSSKYSFKCPYAMTPEEITYHETANDASAMSEVSYMIGNDKQVSFHWAVDDLRAVQGVEENRNTWNSGDGLNGRGNRKSIAIECCYSKSGGEKFTKARDNAIILIAMKLKQYGWGVDKIFFHNSRSGKYCPHRTLSEGIALEQFRGMVQKRYDELYSSKKETDKTPSIVVGSKVRINAPYKRYIADDVQKKNGIYQIRENTLAGGSTSFEWTDNGIPEGCVDLTDNNGMKRSDSDKVHAKKGDYFVFPKTFTVKAKGVFEENGKTYVKLDYNNNSNYHFWVIIDRCIKV